MNRAIDGSYAKIQPKHLERAAYVYVRQSSPRQVVEHLESRRRQYERVDWAVSTAIFIDVYLGVGEHIWRWFEGDPHQGS